MILVHFRMKKKLYCKRDWSLRLLERIRYNILRGGVIIWLDWFIEGFRAGNMLGFVYWIVLGNYLRKLRSYLNRFYWLVFLFL